MDRDSQQMFVRVGPNFIPLTTDKERKAERAEKIGAVVFLVVLSLSAFLMLWATP